MRQFPFDSGNGVITRSVGTANGQQFREIIETLYAGNRIELFARKPHDGWDVWGNEV